jgi:hypothetical protein
MKLILLAALLVAATGPSNASDVGVSVSIGQPGFYGQLDIGGYPPPQVIYRQPRVSYDSPPLYLRVPPGHAKNWSKHCGAYNACNQRVFFVKDSWYNKQYVPRYHERNSGHRDDNEGRKHGNNR